jgi:hypothetical protein
MSVDTLENRFDRIDDTMVFGRISDCAPVAG